MDFEQIDGSDKKIAIKKHCLLIPIGNITINVILGIINFQSPAVQPPSNTVYLSTVLMFIPYTVRKLK